jgi:hypothetical protein
MLIPLQEVPTKLFDQTAWTFFRLRFASYDEALKAISENATSFSPALASATSKSDLDRLIDGTQPYDLRSMEVQEFHRRLEIRELSATGMRSGDNRQQRVPITSSQARQLHFDFGENKAVGLFETYEHVEISERVSQNSEQALPKQVIYSEQALLKQVISFLETTRGSDIPDKARRAGCESELGVRIPERTFRSAIRQVFRRGRGRPPKQSSSV